MPRRARAACVFALVCAPLGASAQTSIPQTPITVQVVNDSGRPDSEVMLLLAGKPVATKTTQYPFSVANVTAVDASLTSPPLTTGAPLQCATNPPPPTCLTVAPFTVDSPYSVRRNLPVYEFTMSTVGSGTLFISYGTGVSYPPAPTVTATYRFQPLEFSYSSAIVSNGDLTSIDFYGIPLQLETFAAGDSLYTDPLDRVGYYTSTPTMLRALANISPDLTHAFVAAGASGNTTFVPGTTSYKDFLRVIGPNQVAAPGVSPLPGTSPLPKPWPYPSFAAYLDALADAHYTFTEADSNQVSAYTFSYTGRITRMTSQTQASCLAPSLAADGWLIKLPGTTTAVSPLPANADICLPLPRADSGNGNADFYIYGAVQNCETIGLAGSDGKLHPCTDSDKTALGELTNSVYGWIQADVWSALNFGYMGGAADAANGGTGRSGIWYGMPPIQYPFALARSGDDGRYNPWAAFMYNHSDAYGFAFSDRNGRPSPDIAFPIGGTLRIWILPDERLDAPFAAVAASDASSITLQWPPVNGADHYVVTWSPPHATASARVAQPAVGPASYAINGLDGGTPYTVSVHAANADESQRSHRMTLHARTQGTPPAPKSGNAQALFGFNWTPPAHLSGQWPDLYLAGNKFTYGGSGSYSTPTPIDITVGLAPASAPLTVTPAVPCTPPCVAMSVSPASIAPNGQAMLTMVISNPATAGSLSLPNGFSAPMPPGVTATASGPQCPGVAVTGSQVVVGAVTLNSSGPNCTIAATLTSSSPGAVVVQAPALETNAGRAPATSAALSVTGSAGAVSLAIAPAVIAAGATATMTATLANATAGPLALTAPFVVAMPGGVTIAAPSSSGTCAGATVGTGRTGFVLPAGATVPPGGCTIVVPVTSSTAGAVIATTGILETDGTVYPTRALPMELRIGNTTIWSANYYLTFIGSPTSYALGPCLPTEACAGSGLSPVVPFDTRQAPNYLDRQGTALTVTGGAAKPGPPFGASPPTIGVSFTPLADKQFGPVSYPKLGAAESADAAPTCASSKAAMPPTACPRQ